VSTVRRTPAGATRTCPHCRAVILQSTSVCPSCRKHLRFAPGAGGDASVPAFSPLRVEGAIKHPSGGEAWEYAVMVSITNDRGEELTRQIVGVGAIHPGEGRKFTFAVEVFTPAGFADIDEGVKGEPSLR
jgi:hypothetical protein